MEAGQQLTGGVDLGGADEESQGSARGEAGGGDEQDLVEPLDGAQGDDLGESRREVFGPPSENIDVRQCKCTDHLAQEGDFLLLGLNQCYRSSRGPDLDGQAGEAGSRADIDEALVACG